MAVLMTIRRDILAENRARRVIDAGLRDPPPAAETTRSAPPAANTSESTDALSGSGDDESESYHGRKLEQVFRELFVYHRPVLSCTERAL